VTRPLARLLALSLLTACGATQSTAILGDTEDLLESAKNSGAEERAPYEYHAAQMYLTGSREQIGLGEYEAAVQLATRARAMARAAREKALSAGVPGTAASEAPPLPDGPMDLASQPAGPSAGTEAR
jgi:hypothetical protein